MHYQFILISTLTTIAFAAPAPPNFRSTNTATTTTTTTTTLNKPTTHIGTPKFAHIPISIPDQRPPHQSNPNLHPVYTPIARPGASTEPGRNPLFSRSKSEDNIKRDDTQALALVAAVRGVAEGLQKQQQHQNARRAENLPNHLPDDIETNYYPYGLLADPENVLNSRAVDNEIYDSEDALDALEYPLQRKEQRGLGADTGLTALLNEEEEENEGYHTVGNKQMSGNVRRYDDYDGEAQYY